jgi:hypothetical protein
LGRNIYKYRLKQSKNERSSFDIFQLYETVHVFLFVNDSVEGFGDLAQFFRRKSLCKSEVKKERRQSRNDELLFKRVGVNIIHTHIYYKT